MDTAPSSPTPTSVPAGVPGLRSYPVRLPRAAVNLTGESEVAADGAPKTAPSVLSHTIAKAPPNSVIHLASGFYPTINDHTQRAGTVTVSGVGDTTKPVIHGARLFGASNVRFVDVRFSKGFHVAASPFPTSHAVSRNIELVNSEVDCGSRSTTLQGGGGVVIRGGSRNIALLGDWVHDCVVGFASVAQDPVSVGVTISHCLFEDFYGDAIDLGGIHDLSITDDVVRDIAHSHGSTYHDDGIQFFGNTADTLIADNVLANSRDQLLFIQDAVAGRLDHTSTNVDVSVIGNLIYGAGAIAVQDQGGVNVDFVGNTVWAGHFGSVLIRKSGYTKIVPNHTLVADNIIEQYGLLDVPGGVVQGYNVFGSHVARRLGPHDLSTRNVGLQAPLHGAFGLTPGSPARNSSAPAPVLLTLARRAGADGAMLALLRSYRSRDRGAVESGSRLPEYGAPFTLTHRPLR